MSSNIERKGYLPHNGDQHRFATEDNLGPFASQYAKLDALPEGVSIRREDDGGVYIKEPVPVADVHKRAGVGPDYQETRVDSKHDIERAKFDPSWSPWYTRFLNATKAKKVAP